jgi:hypothetical protein
MEARTTTSAHGVTLVRFRTPASHTSAADEIPFPVDKHNVYFERHEDAPNCLRFINGGYVTLSHACKSTSLFEALFVEVLLLVFYQSQ